jgi:hypothetical protein
MVRWLAAAASTAVMTVGFVASAQPTSGPSLGVELAWTAPVECPSRAAVLGQVRAILEGGAASAHAVEATATVERAGPRWRVALTIRSDQGSGVRSLDADSCEALGSAVALIVALAVDPTRRAPPDAGAPSSGDAPVPHASPTDADAGAGAQPLSAVSPRPRSGMEGAQSADGPRLAVGAMGAADVGDLPSAAVGGSVAVAGLYRRGRLEVRGRSFASQRAADLARPAQGVELAYLGLDARACLAVLATGRAAREGVAVSPCLGVDLSRIAGSGFGGSKTFSGDGSWSAIEAGLLGTWALAPSVALRVGVDLLVPTSRPGFVVLAPDGSTEESLHRPAPIAGRFDVGAELRFW